VQTHFKRCQIAYKPFLWIFVLFLGDRTAARSMIGYWHDTVVCPSFCLFVSDDVYCGVQSRCRRLKLESCNVVFLRGDFLFTSSDTFAVGCIVWPQAVRKLPDTKSRLQFETKSKYLCWPRLFQTTVCSYTVRRTYAVRSAITSTAEILVIILFLASAYSHTWKTKAKTPGI